MDNLYSNIPLGSLGKPTLGNPTLGSMLEYLSKANPKYYHIYLNKKPGIRLIDVEAAMNFALDWFRYDEYCWIAYTPQHPDVWLERLKKFAEPEGNLFVCELNISNRNGWMSKSFWDWLQKKR